MKTNNINNIRIGTDNYIEFMLDYFDGTLSDELTAQLLELADSNPDIKKEIDEFQNITLTPENESFSLKNDLYKSEADEMEISQAYFLMIKQMEEGLNESETEHLNNLKEKDPGLSDAQKLLLATRLKPGNESFAGKGSIRRVRIIGITHTAMRRVVAAAAMVALIISTSLRTNTLDDGERLATITPATEIPEPVTIETPEKKENIIVAAPEQTYTLRKTTVIETKHEVPAAISAERMQPMVALTTETAMPQADINAFELGVNHMMPLYVAMLQNKNVQPAPPSKPVPLKIALLDGGIKLLSIMSGSKMSLNTEADEAGNIVAYSVITENNIYNRQLKR